MSAMACLQQLSRLRLDGRAIPEPVGYVLKSCHRTSGARLERLLLRFQFQDEKALQVSLDVALPI